MHALQLTFEGLQSGVVLILTIKYSHALVFYIMLKIRWTPMHDLKDAGEGV